MCDPNNDLIKPEYEALRVEIDTAKDRLFKLFISGITVPLAAIGIMMQFPEIVVPVLVGLPLLLLAIFYRHEYERKVIKRAGRYIREVLESKSNSLLGWETWLNNNNHDHMPSKSLNLSFIFLITTYYFSPIFIYGFTKILRGKPNPLQYVQDNSLLMTIMIAYVAAILVIYLNTMFKAEWR